MIWLETNWVRKFRFFFIKSVLKMKIRLTKNPYKFSPWLTFSTPRGASIHLNFDVYQGVIHRLGVWDFITNFHEKTIQIPLQVEQNLTKLWKKPKGSFLLNQKETFDSPRAASIKVIWKLTIFSSKRSLLLLLCSVLGQTFSICALVYPSLPSPRKF